MKKLKQRQTPCVPREAIRRRRLLLPPGAWLALIGFVQLYHRRERPLPIAGAFLIGGAPSAAARACRPASVSPREFGRVASFGHHLRARRGSSSRSTFRRRRFATDRDSPNDSFYWEGDDRRLWTRWVRNARSKMSRWIENQPGRAAILLGNVILYGYQLATAAAWMRTRFPREWKIHWPRIVADVAAGSALPGPLLRRGGLAGAVPTAGGFAAAIRSQEPHRYFLSGWLHGSVLHCLLDCHALARILPPWLETGLGTPLYLTTYLASVLSSNLGHQLFAAAEGRAVFESSPAFHCGASGGICGLYGLLIVTVLRMRAGSAGGEGFGRRRWIGLMWLLLYGSFIPEVSTAGNVSGLVGGALVGAVFGPRYASSYGMKRKWSTEIDAYPRDYRRAMGFANQPRPSLLPLSLLWSAAALLLAAVPSLRSAPLRMIQAILLVP